MVCEAVPTAPRIAKIKARVQNTVVRPQRDHGIFEVAVFDEAVSQHAANLSVDERSGGKVAMP